MVVTISSCCWSITKGSASLRVHLWKRRWRLFTFYRTTIPRDCTVRTASGISHYLSLSVCVSVYVGVYVSVCPCVCIHRDCIAHIASLSSPYLSVCVPVHKCAWFWLCVRALPFHLPPPHSLFLIVSHLPSLTPGLLGYSTLSGKWSTHSSTHSPKRRSKCYQVRGCSLSTRHTVS